MPGLHQQVHHSGWGWPPTLLPTQPSAFSSHSVTCLYSEMGASGLGSFFPRRWAQTVSGFPQDHDHHLTG